MNFPTYKSHKRVEAFKIQSITAQALGTAEGNVIPPVMVNVPHGDGFQSVYPAPQKTEYVLTDETGKFSVVVDEDFMERHNVYTEGYFVRYDNGHQSFSPKEAFEEGYTISEEKAVIVIRVGDESWTPDYEDMEQLVELFKDAVEEPKGAIVAVNSTVRLGVEQVLRTEAHNMYVCSVETPEALKEILKQEKENQ